MRLSDQCHAVSAAPSTWERSVRDLLRQPDQQQLVRDCYFDDPVEAAAARYASSGEWNAIRCLLPASRGRAIDLGAGRGITSYALAMEGWSVVAIEPDPGDHVGCGAIRRLASFGDLPIEVRQEFGEDIGFPDSSFDLVFARQAMHHARDLRRFCREAHRVLRPGGYFIAVRDHVLSAQSDLQTFLDAHPLHRYSGAENAHTLKTYLEALSTSGLTIETILGPLDSVINYAPHTADSLREELIARIGQVLPGASRPARVMLSRPSVFRAVLSVVSRLDRRPGRLYSFKCMRPINGR
jgi:SAM-dependent methyltransferase